MPDMTKPEWTAQKTYDENRAVQQDQGHPAAAHARGREAAVRQVLLRRDPAAGSGALRDHGRADGPGRRVLPRGHQPAARRAGARGGSGDRLVQPAQRGRLHRQQDPLPGVHRRHGRLVVRVAPARGPALPHLVPAAARRHHAEPHRPGPHPRRLHPQPREELGRRPQRDGELRLRLREHRHRLPLAGRHGLRHGEVRQGGGDHGGRHGLGRDGRQERRVHHRAGAHGATCSTTLRRAG